MRRPNLWRHWLRRRTEPDPIDRAIRNFDMARAPVLVSVQAVTQRVLDGEPVSADEVSDALLHAEALGLTRSEAVLARWMAEPR